ncbi:MAG TPA: YlbF family regulator [Anaerolineaceae bacterium]
MACCSATDIPQTVIQSDPGIARSADRLAAILAQTPEFQEYTRLASLINLDPDVRRLSFALRQQRMMAFASTESSVDALQAELEDLPAIQTYHQAEAQVKELFHAVDAVISTAAGVKFAANAQNSGCG